MVDFETELAQSVRELPSDTSIPWLKNISEETFRETVRRLVGLLRERRPAGLADALAPIFAERNHVLSNELSSDGKAILEDYDRLLLTALTMRYDALDAAVRETSFAVAEIDSVGRISYANKALTKIVPDAISRDFAALFGPRSKDVTGALSDAKRDSLRLDLHRGNLPVVNLRGEIGPLSDEYSRLGAYALLLDVEGELARFDALPDGILRLDHEGNVVFANTVAKKIFGDPGTLLRGRSVSGLFRVDSSIEETPAIERWLSANGHKEMTEAQPLDDRPAIPVRLTIVPSFDTAESRSGWVLTIVPIARELAQTEMQRLLSVPELEPEALVRGIVQAIQKIIPYDLATFGVYTEDMEYHNTLVVHPQPAWAWTTAWFPLDPGGRQFLLGKQTWGADFQEAVRTLAPSLDDDPVLKHLIDSKMKGFVTLPITGGGKYVRASLTLLSEQANQFNGEEIEEMRDLGVEKALLVAEANMLRRHDDRVRELEARLAQASKYWELAQALANGIADCFGWDYVAIFGVDRRKGVFRLIHQCNRTGSPNVDDSYTQDLSEGLLGEALRKNALCIETNIEAGLKHRYKPVVPGRRSALAMPIRVVRQAAKPAADEIEWLLSIESNQRNAFQGPKMRALEKLLAQCEGLLHERWQKAVQVSLLDASEQAVIVVDRAGQIRLTNGSANNLLCQGNGVLLGKMLADYGARGEDKDWLKTANHVAGVRLKLSPDGLVDVPTLAMRRPINDDYGHQLWLFTDLREEEQQRDWGYLEQTVNEVAQNARLPLMLAGNLLRGAAEKVFKDPAISDMLAAAVRHLGKVDITYERLATTLSVRQEPDRPPQIFDVMDVLRQVVADLPDDDIRHCDLTDLVDTKGRKPFLINGWPDQLGFAFRSLLGYLFFRRPTDSRVNVALSDNSTGKLSILLSVPISPGLPEPKKPTDRISKAEQRAHAATALAPDAVQLAVRRHGGDFRVHNQDGTMSAFEIMLSPLTL
jgi:PAS domain-containing protein